MTTHNSHHHLPLLLLFLFLHLATAAAATHFIFNKFNQSDILLFSYAEFNPPNILSLTNSTQFTTGRALFPSKIPTKFANSSRVLPFATSFIFSMAPYPHLLPGHGIVFLFVPFRGRQITVLPLGIFCSICSVFPVIRCVWKICHFNWYYEMQLGNKFDLESYITRYLWFRSNNGMVEHWSDLL